jgi:hypothetical protein
MWPSSLQMRPKQTITFSECPREVPSLIMIYCGGTDLKRCRLVSRQLCRLATPVLFSRLTVDCYHVDLHGLAMLAALSYLAPLIREVVFDISDLSIGGLLRRLKEVYLRSIAKCHSGLLPKLKNRSKLLGTFKPCHHLVSVPREDTCTDLLSHSMTAFQSFTRLQTVRIVDRMSQQSRLKPLLHGFHFTIMGVSTSILNLKDHRLRQLPFYDFHHLFSAVVLLALRLVEKQPECFDGYCPSPPVMFRHAVQRYGPNHAPGKWIFHLRSSKLACACTGLALMD